MPKRKAKLLIGCSGWSYSHWGKGVFYPPQIKAAQYLEYYCQHFKTVEINNSFYRLPKSQYLDRWHQGSGRGFVFAAKIHRQITHFRKLRNCRDALKANAVLAEHLDKKLGPLLFQLPPSLHADHSLLADFLDLLASDAGSWIKQAAFEFRHESWLTDKTYELLNQAGCAICLADWHSCKVRETNDAKFVYIRRHGPSGPYAGCYTSRGLRGDAQKIVQYLLEGKDVYAYFNNDIQGYAVRNAKALQQLVDQSLK